jgi:hypothetical protein
MNSTALSWAESRYWTGICKKKMQAMDAKHGQENPILQIPKYRNKPIFKKKKKLNIKVRTRQGIPL